MLPAAATMFPVVAISVDTFIVEFTEKTPTVMLFPDIDENWIILVDKFVVLILDPVMVEFAVSVLRRSWFPTIVENWTILVDRFVVFIVDPVTVVLAETLPAAATMFPVVAISVDTFIVEFTEKTPTVMLFPDIVENWIILVDRFVAFIVDPVMVEFALSVLRRSWFPTIVENWTILVDRFVVFIVEPVTVVLAEMLPAAATMFPVVAVMPVPAVTVVLAEMLPAAATMFPVVAISVDTFIVEFTEKTPTVMLFPDIVENWIILVDRFVAFIVDPVTVVTLIAFPTMVEN